MSPIDAIPSFIPVLGQLDDLAVALAALRLALDGLTPSRRQAHLEAVGLDDATLAADARTVGVAAAWMARAGARAAGETVIIGIHLGMGVTKTAAGVASKGLRTTARLGGGAVARIPSSRGPLGAARHDAGRRSQSTQRSPSHQRCQIQPSVPGANTSSRSSPHDDAVGAPLNEPPSDSHACHDSPSQ